MNSMKKIATSKSSVHSKKKNKLIFYCVMMAFPVAQALVFYFYINFNSFLLAFQEYDLNTGEYVFSGLVNFKKFFVALNDPQESFIYSIPNSFLIFFISLLFTSATALFFSYYIYKKKILSGFYKIILYTPHIISGVTFTIIYKYFVCECIPEFGNLFSLTIPPLIGQDIDTTKVTIIVFTIWISFGANILLYSGAMSGISDSLIESGELDGTNTITEFVYIILPMIWPTFITFMVMSVSGLFTNQMNLYSFYGEGAPTKLYTLGYWLYRETKIGSFIDYPYLSAVGMLITCIAVPLTLTVKYLLERFGPSVEEKGRRIKV